MKRALVVCSCWFAACAYTPAAQERIRAEEILRGIKHVVSASVGCAGAVMASDALCAEVTFTDDLAIHFAHVGMSSFGPKARAVIVTEASGLVPLVASCNGVEPPNFHRDAPLGAHFHPPLIDLRDAVVRY